MKNLKREKDVQESKTATERQSLNFIKLDPVTFVVIVSPDYTDGFFHFVGPRGKGGRTIPCKAGLDGRGFSPESCPACADALALYNKAKELKEKGKADEAEGVKKQGNALRAFYQMFLHAVKADAIWVKNKAGKKEQRPDFDDVKEVQVLALSDHQKKLMMSLIDNPDFPKIEKGEDLVGVVLKFVREAGGNKKVIEVLPVGKLALGDLDVDMKQLPDLDRYTNIPEDYESKLEELSGSGSMVREETEEESEEEDEDEFRIPKRSKHAKKEEDEGDESEEEEPAEEEEEEDDMPAVHVKKHNKKKGK